VSAKIKRPKWLIRVAFPVLALVLLFSGCSSNESADGTRDAGNCTTFGEIVDKGNEVAICLNINGEARYLIEGPAIDDIRLLAGINWLDFFLSDEGQALVSNGSFVYDDFASIDVDSLNLKRFIVNKPEWKNVAALILAEEEAWGEVESVKREYCPQLIEDPNAFCAPKIMSDEGSSRLFEASDLWNVAVERLDKELDLIGVSIEGQYQLDGLKAAEFALRKLREED